MGATVDELRHLGLAVRSRGRSIYALLGGQPRLGWLAAERKAVALGGHLVTINSAAENRWLTRQFRSLPGVDDCGLWIGLNDRRQEGRFRWTSGQRSDYSNWVPKGTPGYPAAEPSNGPGEDHVHLYFNTDAMGRWKDSVIGYHDVALSGAIAEFRRRGPSRMAMVSTDSVAQGPEPWAADPAVHWTQPQTGASPFSLNTPSNSTELR